MSSRLKKIKRSVASDRIGLRGTRPKPRWIPVSEMDRFPYSADDGELHLSSCHVTGEMFARPIDKRYRGMNKKALRSRYRDLCEMLVAMGGQVPPVGGPLWQRVEFLENVLDFEIDPPCSCRPTLSA